MTKNSLLVISALALLLVLNGCAIGYNTTLFATKSNVGLDADMKPPTFEVSIARREGVMEPTFEDGKTPPVMASFRLESGFYVPPFAKISSTFAGGDAAVAMATLYASPLKGNTNADSYDSTLWLRRPPAKRILGIPIKLHRPGEANPFLFGTDTSFGLKAAWSGLTAQFPDTVKLGMSRKEFALAPVYGTAVESEKEGRTNTYKVKMPSFLATLDNSTSLGAVTNSHLKHLQYFATGLAADRLAIQPAVREAMVARLDPVSAEKALEIGRKFADTDSAKTLRDWVNNPKTEDILPGKTARDVRKERQDKIKNWIPSDAGYSFADFLYRADLESERQRFLQEKARELNIPQ